MLIVFETIFSEFLDTKLCTFQLTLLMIPKLTKIYRIRNRKISSFAKLGKFLNECLSKILHEFKDFLNLLKQSLTATL